MADTPELLARKLEALADSYEGVLSPNAYGDVVILRAAAKALLPGAEPVAWACKNCNSPRAVSPCRKCGGELFKPADGWEWPELPPIDRIRELAREVGYAIGVHGSQERDLDLIALQWTGEAVAPQELAEHIAVGLGGRVLTSNHKHPGRWACNISIEGWYKLIDLSVAAPPLPANVLSGEPGTQGDQSGKPGDG